MLMGTLHQDVKDLIPEEWEGRKGGGGWYAKWIFEPGSFNDGNAGDRRGLPEGYEIGTLDEAELQRILDGSPIPRTLQYLKEVVNAGIYFRGQSDVGEVVGKGELVAYSFLGKDGSLGGLDVQADHRGKGLAGLLAKELFRRQAGSFGRGDTPLTVNWDPDSDYMRQRKKWWMEDEIKGYWAHSDVGEDNTPSQNVMRKLGGKVQWRICWVEVDLALVPRSEAS
jgi:GNAT superfamily N-acetyltransferase